jgi:hypothetical protein
MSGDSRHGVASGGCENFNQRTLHSDSESSILPLSNDDDQRKELAMLMINQKIKSADKSMPKSTPMPALNAFGSVC